MATHTITFITTPGAAVTAYPLSQSLGDWDTYKVTLAEDGAPDTGRFSGDIDDQYGPDWRVFVTASQPANWGASAASWSRDVDLRPLQTLSAVSDTLTITPDPNRTFYPRRGYDTPRMTKRSSELVRFYVDFQHMLGTNESLGAVGNVSVAVGSSGMTVASGSIEKAGSVISFEAASGTTGSQSITIQTDSDTGDPLEAELLFTIV